MVRTLQDASTHHLGLGPLVYALDESQYQGVMLGLEAGKGSFGSPQLPLRLR